MSFWRGPWTQLPEGHLFHAIGDHTRPQYIVHQYIQSLPPTCSHSPSLSCATRCLQRVVCTRLSTPHMSVPLDLNCYLHCHLSHPAEMDALVLLLSERLAVFDTVNPTPWLWHSTRAHLSSWPCWCLSDCAIFTGSPSSAGPWYSLAHVSILRPHLSSFL